MIRFLPLAFLLLTSCSMIGPGQKGVRTQFGAITPGQLNPGAHFWFPHIMGITKFDLRVQKSIIETTGSSKDLQNIHTDIAINWRLDPACIEHFYRDVGSDKEAAIDTILKPAVSEVLKSALAKKTAEEIVSRRVELKKDIDDNINERLSRYAIIVDDISIVDVSFSREFINAIESKQIAEQEAQRAGYIALKAIKEAEAEVNAARGSAEAQRLVKSTLTSEVLKKMAIEKWDGHFPHVMSGALPLLNLKVE